MADPLDTLLWGGGVIQTQGPKPRTMAQAQAPAAADPLDRLLFPDTPAPQAPAPEAAPAPFAGYKDPKTEGWLEWIGKNITGRTDPRFANAPGISRVLENEIYDNNSDPARASYRQITLGQSLTPDDKAHADIVRSALGNRFIGAEKDAYGADVVRYRDKDGQEAVAYVNKPGLDLEDVNNLGLQSLPYILGGRIVQGLTRNMSLPMKMMGQAGAASTTSAAGDIAAMGAGSEQGIDFGRATAVGLMGGAAEALSPVLGMLGRRFITEPKLLDKSTGQLTQKGAEAAKKAGFDPSDVTGDIAEQFTKEYARIQDPVVVGQSVRTKEFGIPVTRGQMLKDPQMLLNEKALRYGALGEPGKNVMKDLDTRQTQAIADAALGADASSIAKAINPSRAGGSVRPSDVGEGIRTGVRSARDAAKAETKALYDDVTDLTATTQALEILPQYVARELGGLSIPPTKDTAPKAAAMLDALRNYKAGGLPKEADEWLGNVMTPTIQSMQRTLVALKKGTDPSDFDGTAAAAIYRGFDKWITDAADKALLKGDALTAAAFRTARERYAEMKSVFSAADKSGRSTPGGRLMEKIAKDDNYAPESIVRSLFGTNPQATPKEGTLEALRRIKTGVTRYLPEDQAKQTWNEIRMAHWLSLVKKSDGSMHSPTVMSTNIKKALQGSVARELYAPAELSQIRRFTAALDDAAWKDPNPSGTATSLVSYASKIMQAILGAMMKAESGPGKLLAGTLAATPITNAVGYVAARSAASPTMRPRNPSLGAIGAGLTAQERESR